MASFFDQPVIATIFWSFPHSPWSFEVDRIVNNGFPNLQRRSIVRRFSIIIVRIVALKFVFNTVKQFRESLLFFTSSGEWSRVEKSVAFWLETGLWTALLLRYLLWVTPAIAARWIEFLVVGTMGTELSALASWYCSFLVLLSHSDELWIKKLWISPCGITIR